MTYILIAIAIYLLTGVFIGQKMKKKNKIRIYNIAFILTALIILLGDYHNDNLTFEALQNIGFGLVIGLFIGNYIYGRVEDEEK